MLNALTHHFISMNIKTSDMIQFTIKVVPDIMEYLKVKNYAIGGGIAGELYGINFGRNHHDIDVIVPEGTIEKVTNIIDASPFVCKVTSTSSTDAEFNTKHLAFRGIKGFTIDLIEYNDFYKEDVYLKMPDYIAKNINIMSIKHLIEAKQKYNRRFDHDDLVKLVEFYDTNYRTKLERIAKISKTDGVKAANDLDALKELKAKLEKQKEEQEEKGDDITL